MERINRLLDKLIVESQKDIEFLEKSRSIGKVALSLREQVRSEGTAWDTFLESEDIPISRAYLYNCMNIALSWEYIEKANKIKRFESLRDVLRFIYPKSKMLEKFRVLYLSAESDVVYSTGL